jgi:hypothetical protein
MNAKFRAAALLGERVGAEVKAWALAKGRSAVRSRPSAIN